MADVRRNTDDLRKHAQRRSDLGWLSLIGWLLTSVGFGMWMASIGAGLFLGGLLIFLGCIGENIMGALLKDPDACRDEEHHYGGS